MRQRCPPVFNGPIPFFRDVVECQIHQSNNSLFARENSLCLNHLGRGLIVYLIELSLLKSSSNFTNQFASNGDDRSFLSGMRKQSAKAALSS